LNEGAGGPRIARPLLLSLLLAVPAARAAEPPEAAARARARAERLGEAPEWLRLGHWIGPRGRRVSDARAGFFLSPSGRTDPEAELSALISGLYAPDPGGGKAARCLFPARAAWAESRLGIAPSSLPPADCSKFEAWRALLDADGVTLVFASSYLDNPSSMFGHTFLRLGRRGTGGDALRDNTLNFAAYTGDDGGLLFAVKGLLGLYPGRYTVMPYYMKVAEYNDMENRDLWEYRLNLSTAEVDRLAAHAWEMGPADFPYFFFSKNCSYQLLPVLEAAAPRLTLRTISRRIVGPVDTLRAVTETPGLVASEAFRPSHATTTLERRALLTPAERRAAWDYAHGRAAAADAETAGWPSARRALVLDAAEDFVLYDKGFSPEIEAPVKAVEREILLRRARVPDPPAVLPKPSWAAPPEEEHARRRWMAGGGVRRGAGFAELAWRPGYHDLYDRPAGFTPGAAIHGLSWRLRYDGKDDRVYVRDFRLVEILSAVPWDSWTRKPSWGLGTGLDTAFELGKAPADSLVYEGHLGAGLSTAPWPGALAFALAGPAFAVGSPLRDGGRMGGELRGGLAQDLGPEWRAVLEGDLAGEVLGDRTPNDRLRADLNWAPSKDRALRLEALWRGHYREAGLYAILYH
jgi:hypothetical protein